METVLLLGGTGRTGRRVMGQLLERGFQVRAVVRSAARVPEELRSAVELIECDFLALSEAEVSKAWAGCSAAVCCLGHSLTFRGIFGPPRSLVTASVKRLCRSIEMARPGKPARLVLMGSVSVNDPRKTEAGRTNGERAFLWLLRLVLPPAKDNQTAAEALALSVGESHPSLEWVVVRPDTLKEGPLSPYAAHDSFVNSLFAAGASNMANVAHFMVELLCDEALWARWRCRLPVLVNSA